ncbi:uroporphyrinogen decarboxylase family protein [Thiohalomonas denitrificans]|uniref:uroporphyrinogen decarboxylase family protein n=1 Tax=Thiohalomonas denitrificans TaxID=415747 RepID=UPI0026EBE05C|nr:uroporphyrinogen decarboxylase family protein [Thiohalomonas denitrificans]
MNGLERVMAAVRFQPTDRLPVVPQLFGHAAVLAGIKLVDYLHDGALLARCQLSAEARYGHDAVFAFMDLSVETEAVGSTLLYRDELYPDVAKYALRPGDDPARLRIPEPRQDGRMPELLHAVSLLRQEAGNRLLIAGSVVGPMTLATQLVGIEDALYFAADDPDGFERLLDYATDVIITFGKAQLQAGAHVPVVFDPSASPAVVPAAFFREFLLPRLKKVLSAFRQNGAITTWLNIAGPTAPILPLHAEAGAEIANFDYYVSATEAQRCLPHTCLDGNLKSLDFVEATPEQVFKTAAALRDSFAGRGGFLLSSGCEIPPESKPENIEAMIAACSTVPPWQS